MKKQYLLAGALFAAMTVGLSLQAAPIVWIENGTKDNIRVAIKNHWNFNNLDNAKVIKKGKTAAIILGKDSRKGPLIFARDFDLTVRTRKGQYGKDEKYVTYYQTPPAGKGANRSYFLPFANVGLYRIRIADRNPKSPEAGMKIKRKWPIRWLKPWVRLEPIDATMTIKGDVPIKW